MYIPLSQGNTVTEDVTPPLRAEMPSEITFFLLLPLKKGRQMIKICRPFYCSPFVSVHFDINNFRLIGVLQCLLAHKAERIRAVGKIKLLLAGTLALIQQVMLL